jgi:hypothetical protein
MESVPIILLKGRFSHPSSIDGPSTLSIAMHLQGLHRIKEFLHVPRCRGARYDGGRWVEAHRVQTLPWHRSAPAVQWPGSRKLQITGVSAENQI